MTERQMKLLLKRFYYHHDKLQKVLNEAHERELISYPDGTYEDLAPCKSHWDTRGRFEDSTRDKISTIIHDGAKKEARE